MELIALISNRGEAVINEVKVSLKRYTVYPLKTAEEFEDLHTNIPINLLVIDTVSHGMSQSADLLNKLDNDTVILITSEKPDRFTLENMPRCVYDCVEVESVRTELSLVVERALERQKFKNVMNMIRESKESYTAAGSNQEMAQTGLPPAHGQHKQGIFQVKDAFGTGMFLQKKALVNFAKMLTVSFDMRKLFNHFMDSVSEITRVSKMSVMLRDKEGFYVKTHFGVDPYIADNLRLKKDSALAVWLAKTGRIRHKPLNPTDTASINIKSEMELLQCTFSFPMIHKGKLIGIFNIDNKITEEPFYSEELEIIYVLCNYLAAAVKDIDLYHQIWYQKEFTKNILSSMTSGVIAIDKDEKITVFNQKASEILNLESSEMVGIDLRSLPSPLGDMLYETMVAGMSYKRYEVEIRAEKLPLGINSYRLLDENQNPIGAGIVFTDLSDSKRLEEQRRRMERLEAVNNLMAKIAHEVRNPMTSIYTYTQLLNDKYKDEELNNFYTTVVFQAIHKLDSLIDKLVIFSSKPEYNFNKEDVNLIIDESSDYIEKTLPSSHRFLKQNLDSPVFINADKKILAKAICYLVLSAVDKNPDDTVITLSAETETGDSPYVEILIRYKGKEFTDEEKQGIFKPLLNIDNLGTELNIPISHKIVEEHNGSLSIKSEDGSNILIIKIPVMREIQELREGDKQWTTKKKSL
ncbi:MAG: PAS domain-containing protein [Nitrospirae bacterium]|nr:PAS domain-containing protein [Nitrospirota bacterium]